MNSEMIAGLFAKRFMRWGITLPAEDLRSLTPGHIAKRGWLIQFCFGNDADGLYLDYYATHRMTGDSHVRLHENGTHKALESFQGLFVTSADPGEAARLKTEFLRSNCKIMEELVGKGFSLFTINMALRTGLVDTETK